MVRRKGWPCLHTLWNLTNWVEKCALGGDGLSVTALEGPGQLQFSLFQFAIICDCVCAIYLNRIIKNTLRYVWKMTLAGEFVSTNTLWMARKIKTIKCKRQQRVQTKIILTLACRGCATCAVNICTERVISIGNFLWNDASKRNLIEQS